MKNWLSGIGMLILGIYVFIDLAKPDPSQADWFARLLGVTIFLLFSIGFAEGTFLFDVPRTTQLLLLLANAIGVGILGNVMGGGLATAWATIWIWFGSFILGYLTMKWTTNRSQTAPKNSTP